ncbi:MAG TPA: hypothetical protein PKI62_10250 [bacterium]|nr:hypothetical protein [bacterium]HPR87446.1 hypothetical protein [bacterium]
MLLVLGGAAHGQQQPGAAWVEGAFITRELGVGAMLLNPGALSTRPDDDGVMVCGIGDKEWKNPEYACAMSMGGLGFAYQQLPLVVDGDELTLKIYRLNLAVGGRVLAIGTSNKVYALEYPHHSDHQFGIDAGLQFQPLSFLRIAALALDCNEPVVGGRTISRRYLLGSAIALFHHTLWLEQQVIGNDATDAFADLTWQAGLVLRPIGRLQFALGYKKTPHDPELYLAQAALPLPIGITVGAALRSDKEFKSKLLAASLLLPLQTLRF